MPKVTCRLHASLITTSNYLPGSSSPAASLLSHFFSIKVNTSGSRRGQHGCKFPFIRQSAIQVIHVESVHNLEIISSPPCAVCAVLFPLKRALPRSISLIAFRGTNPINWAALALNCVRAPEDGFSLSWFGFGGGHHRCKRPGQKVVTVENTYNLKQVASEPNLCPTRQGACFAYKGKGAFFHTRCCSLMAERRAGGGRSATDVYLILNHSAFF